MTGARSFSVVGAGRLGTSLAAALARRGWKPLLIVDPDARAARACRLAAGAVRATRALRAGDRPGGTVFVAVPDGELARVAAGLARSGVPWAGRAVFHTSGLLPARLLAPLAAKGAVTAALHPAQSFPRPDAPASAFKGITWGIEGEPAGVEAATAVVRALGGRALLLAEKDKALYHAACVLASNAVAALQGAAAGLLAAVGLGEEEASGLLLPLAQRTLQNVKDLGPEKALTGPVARGDAAAVRKHLEALRAHPAAREAYLALGRRSLELAERRGLARGRVRSLRRLLGGG